MKYLQGIALLIASLSSAPSAETIYDDVRNRNIPISVTYPTATKNCTVQAKCPVALLSAGYRVHHNNYTFLVHQLNALGFLVVAVGHELPNDPPLSRSGNLFKTRSENWQRGAVTLDFVKSQLSQRFERYDFERLLLVGHSNGGDISSWLSNEGKPYIKTLITLDHRRVPLPRGANINVLSIRASDYPADEGVLPSPSELSNSCIVKIPKAKHNDITDDGPEWLKHTINMMVQAYLKSYSCAALTPVNLVVENS